MDRKEAGEEQKFIDKVTLVLFAGASLSTPIAKRDRAERGKGVKRRTVRRSPLARSYFYWQRCVPYFYKLFSFSSGSIPAG